MAKPSALWKSLRDYALTLPETHEDFPWGDRVIKVRAKVFVWLGEGDAPDATIGLKLAESHDAALSLPDAKPMAYGLGKAGWVVVPLRAPKLDADVWRDWITESYTLIAPKKLVAQLS